MERKRRIFGVETEFASLMWDNEKKRFLSDDYASRFIDFAVGGHNQYLENGARVYLDVGVHIESATPECDSPIQAALYEEAMEKRISSRNKEFNDRILDSSRAGSSKKFILLKNNADFNGHSYGCHENYLISSDLWCELALRSAGALSRAFQLFLAVRTILCGSGYVTKEMQFLFSRRATFIKCVANSNSQSDRPIIHQKNETLAGPDSSRLHLLVADSNMSEFSTYLRVGTTHLLLLALERLMRKRIPIKSSIFSHRLDVIRLLKEVNMDITRANRYHIGLLKSVSVCGIHRLLIDFVNETIGDIISKEEKEILALWHKCVGKIEEGDDDYLSSRLDWAIKKRLMEGKLEKFEMDPGLLIGRRILSGWNAYGKVLSQLLMLDLMYHDTAESGIYNQLVGREAVERLLADSEIEKAKTIPPETRAAWRGNIISYFNKTLRSASDSSLRHDCWTQISIAAKGEAVRFINTNPYEKNWSDAKYFIDRLAN